MVTATWKQRVFRVLDRVVPTVPFRYMPPKQSVRLAFNVILDREPDPAGGDEYAAKLASGELSRHGVAQALAHSEEFRRQVPIADVLLSMHVSRSEFVAGLPRASRILDLGGTHQGLADGALVHLGYPYPFTRLVVVDLPVEERHEIYQRGSQGATVQSPLGPVEFAFHSMVDLSPYADGSFDLVYSGQSIEHVTEAEGDRVVREAFRVLAPGGWFCLDTPNGPVWRLRSAALMNDDHKIEYGAAALQAKLEAGGFEVTEAKGLNLMQRAVAAGVFDEGEASAHPGVFAAIEDCLLLALVARKPVTASSPP
jgi:SAM-dependent methyltransferase